MLSIFAAALALNAHAGTTFREACPDVAACAKAVGELLGQKYVFTSDVKTGVQGTPNLELTKENAEWVFTNMLYLEGYSRVPIGPTDTYQIVRVRDARDSAIPLVEANAKTAPELPNNWDYLTLRYKATNPDSVEQIARMMRNFMPPHSRIIPSELNGALLVTDSAPNLRKMYELIRDLDRKPTAEMKRKWAEETRRFQEELAHRRRESREEPVKKAKQ